MKKTGLLLLLFLSFGAFAQGDLGNKPNPILPASSSAIPDNPILPKTPSIFDVKPKETKSLLDTNKKDLMTQQQFVDANKPFVEKLNKQQLPEGNEQQKAIRKNQYFGDLKTGSASATIRYRDSEFVDGDEIRIYANGNIVRNIVTLSGSFQGFELTLQPGFNNIEFEALNQGSSGPNTAQFEIYDEKGNLLAANTWNLATGFKANMIIVKQ